MVAPEYEWLAYPNEVDKVNGIELDPELGYVFPNDGVLAPMFIKDGDRAQIRAIIFAFADRFYEHCTTREEADVFLQNIPDEDPYRILYERVDIEEAIVQRAHEEEYWALDEEEEINRFVSDHSPLIAAVNQAEDEYIDEFPEKGQVVELMFALINEPSGSDGQAALDVFFRAVDSLD